MSEVTYETMLRRIERLERSNRAMKFIVLGAIAASLAFNAFPAMSSVFPHGPKQTDAERFNLVSPKGALLATFGQTANGGYLSFYDAKGNLEMNLGAGAPDAANPTNTSVGIAIYDGNALLPRSDAKPGVARMVWAGDATAGVPTVFGESIFDANQNVRLSDATAGDGTNGGAFFYDASQTLRASIGFGNNGPGAFFNDSTGTSRLLEGVAGDDSSASFSLMNIDATQALYDLSASGDGSATTFQIKDKSGVTRVTEGYSTNSNEIILLDNASNAETFRAPCTGAACP
jgi:hypothetical protein